MLSGMCGVGASAGCRPSPIADGVPRFGETRLTVAAAQVGEWCSGKGLLVGTLACPGATAPPRRHGQSGALAALHQRLTSDWPTIDQ